LIVLAMGPMLIGGTVRVVVDARERARHAKYDNNPPVLNHAVAMPQTVSPLP
jgi:hypothetical protein